MSTEQTTAPVDTAAAQPATSELQPGQGVPVDGVGAVEGAQPDAAAAEAAAAAQAEADKATANRERANRRFSDLSREAKQAREEAAYWRGVAEAAHQGQQPPQGVQPQPAPAQADGPPNPGDLNRYPAGEFDPQYVRDLARFEAKEILRTEREEASKREAFEAGRSRFLDARAQAEAEGFEGGAETLDLIARRDRATVDIITAAENPAWIAEHFARNPGDLQHAMSLNPHQRALFIGRLDMRFSTYLAAQPRQDQAPASAPASAPAHQAAPAPQLTPPPSTLPGRGPTPSFNPETASIAEYEARLAAARGTR